METKRTAAERMRTIFWNHLAFRAPLRHRLFTNFTADAEGIDVEHILGKLLETVSEPGDGEPGAARHPKLATPVKQ